MREGAYRNEINSGFSIRADILQVNSARALNRNAARVALATFYSGSDFDHAHIVEQHSFGAILQS